MALTQSARLPGPSWDEEVVPALRKRLENESRTLARRMSAISMSSNAAADDNPYATFASNSASDGATISRSQQNNYDYHNTMNGMVGASSGSSSHTSRPGYQNEHPTTPSTDQYSGSVANASRTPTSSRVVNGARKLPVATSFHRSRTFSQPYRTPYMNAGIRQPRRTNTTDTGLGSRSPRMVEAKPTRIPKVSRGPSGSITSASSPLANGTSLGVSHSATPTPVQTPNPNLGHAPEIRAFHFPTSHSVQGISQTSTARLINEPPPFNTDSVSSSIYNIHEELSIDDFGFSSPRLSRDSVDSAEERPFEHWYRGEVSRNGGVGELRVGRRQEMLEIANYGHAINNKRKMLANRQAALLAMEQSRRASIRKRAESVTGLGRLRPGMMERGSLYLDDDAMLDVGMVLDEDPLTDLDGEETSDIASISTKGQPPHDRRPYRYSNHDTEYLPGVGDITISTGIGSGYSDTSLPSPRSPTKSYGVDKPKDDEPPQQQTSAAPTQPAKPATPTQAVKPSTPTQSPIAPAPTPTPRSKSRQGSSSSRIPTYERRSSESRHSSHTQHSSSTTKAGQQQHQNVVDLTSVSSSPSPSPPHLPTTTTTGIPNGRPSQIPSTPSTAVKRGISPGPHSTPGPSAKKPRTPVSSTPAKAKPKPKSAIKKPSTPKEGDNRKSVAQYPTPKGKAGEEEGDMADAIPYWTQPKVVGEDGKWDDVVLPVVARKKGLDDYYEKVDGSPQPRKKDKTPVAPAPGTFGYDGTKNRRKGTSDEDIEMDEFGRPNSDIFEDAEPSKLLEPEPTPNDTKTEVSLAHDNIRVPIKPPPSPAPFSHYAPTGTIVVTRLRESENEVGVEQDTKDAGCCKCVIM